MPIFEKNEQKYRVRITLSNIGALYYGMRNYNQSEYYYNASQKIASELNDIDGLAQNYDGLSSIYLHNKEYDKALESEMKAYELYKSIHYPIYETTCLSGIAQIYYKGFNNLKLAREYAQKALTLADSIGAPNHIASSLCMLSNVAYHEGNYKACVEYAHKAFETDSSDYNMLTNILGNMATGNIQLGNTNEAIKYFNLYTKSINKLTNNDFLTAMSEMEVKYETEKKTIKITALEKQEKLYKYLILSALVSLLFLTILIIYRHILSKKEKLLARQKIIQLEQEKKLVATQAVLEGETAERTRLAKDLHDGLGGMLSVVKLNLNGMKNYSVLDAENVDQFNKTVNMLDNSIKELRRIAHHMMPESLLRYGLKASLSDFCNAVPNVDFHYFGNEQRIDSNLEILTYRAAHELVNNAIKHSQANQINVQIVQEPDRLSLTVQDNGIGFDPKIQTKGMGLKNIRDRVSTFNGKMNIYSEPGKGTEINIEFNYNNTAS